MSEHLRVLGLTGGIASGKSTASRYLVGRGAACIDADRIGHALLAPGGCAVQAVEAAFGADRLHDAQGRIDRRRLGSIVFADSEALARLNRIMHPRIAAAAKDQIQTLQRQHPPPPLILLDAALLYEAGWERLCDAVCVIFCAPQIAIRRLIERNGFTPEQAQQRLDAQWEPERKARRADVVIRNDGTLTAFQAELAVLWEAYATTS